MGLVLGLFEDREATRQPDPSPLARGAGPPEPRLETRPGELRRRLEAAQQQILDSYAWLDRERGIVRIPIERAMEVLAERGLPARGSRPPARPQQSDAPVDTMEEGPGQGSDSAGVDAAGPSDASEPDEVLAAGAPGAAEARADHDDPGRRDDA